VTHVLPIPRTHTPKPETQNPKPFFRAAPSTQHRETIVCDRGWENEPSSCPRRTPFSSSVLQPVDPHDQRIFSSPISPFRISSTGCACWLRGEGFRIEGWEVEGW